MASATAPAATTTNGAEIRTSSPSAVRPTTPVARPRSVSTCFTLQARDDPRARLAGLRQGVEVDAALGVVGAADRALAGAAAAGRVAAQGRVLPVQRRRSLERQFAVAPQHLHRGGSDADRRFDVGDSGAEQLKIGEGQAMLLVPGLATSVGGRKQVPELITVVPPTARPSGSAIGGLPSAIVVPPSR